MTRRKPATARAKAQTRSAFHARLARPLQTDGEESWTFVVLPAEASAKLPRRGRLTVAGTIDGQPFQARLEPDGRRSHWLRIDERLRLHAKATVGQEARFEIEAVEPEPDPEPPADLARALCSAPQAQATWDATTTIARVDWIHWIESAKQADTRRKRIDDACDMLAAGKKRVCCFDPSGYYSKALSAPQAENQGRERRSDDVAKAKGDAGQDDQAGS